MSKHTMYNNSMFPLSIVEVISDNFMAGYLNGTAIEFSILARNDNPLGLKEYVVFNSDFIHRHYHIGSTLDTFAALWHNAIDENVLGVE